MRVYRSTAVQGSEFQGELLAQIGGFWTALLDLDMVFNNLSGMLLESLRACGQLLGPVWLEDFGGEGSEARDFCVFQKFSNSSHSKPPNRVISKETC
ncbi:unnamed protein product [Cuscuta europaea]|uniref:Uncharacterized protein n=1 Tax=Cuscuta europaea TaxID=41803 RepID=A0A9P0ZHF8_CUSEU|nr:unnamed protein product [Cuscuta europaea]